MPARLTLHPAERPLLRLTVFEGQSYLLGRDADCDLAIDDDRVSRRHARLDWAEEGWTLRDLGSKNGVSVAGLATSAARVEPGTWFSLGGVVGRFELLDAEAARRDVEQRERRWQNSAEHQRRLDPTAGIDRLLEQILASVLELSGGARGFVLLAGVDGLEVAAASGLGLDELKRPEFAGSVGAVARALDRGRPVVVADVDSDLSLAARPSVLAGGIRALACVPLVALGRQIGALYTDSPSSGSSFEALDLQLLEAFASHAALALAVARLDGELARLVTELPRLTALSGPAQAELARALSVVRPGAPPPAESWSGSRAAVWSEVVALHAGAAS